MVESEDLYYEKQRMIMHLDLRKEVQLFEDDDLAVFPPVNHENLYIDVFENSPSESSSPSSSLRRSDSSSSSLSPSDSDEQFAFNPTPPCQPTQTNGKFPPFWWWWKLLLTRALSKFQNLMTLFSISSLCFFSRTLGSFYPVLGIVIWWWRRNRTRRREIKLESHLRDTIKEKDERIAQLLHQIVQMNELLVKNKHSR